jgi:hypothetical protein
MKAVNLLSFESDNEEEEFDHLSDFEIAKLLLRDICVQIKEMETRVHMDNDDLKKLHQLRLIKNELMFSL